MRKLREERSEEKVDKEREEAKEKMRRLRAKNTDEEVIKEREEARERMTEWRAARTEEEKKYIMIVKKHKIREKRKQRTGKEHLVENLKAKKGMKRLEDEGGLEEFAYRSGRKTREIDDWELYFKGSKMNSNFLENKKPDIVQVLNEKRRKEIEELYEKRRIEKEKERQREEEVKERGGEWCYNAEMEMDYWVGEGEPEIDSFQNHPLTKEDLKQIKEQEEKEFEDLIKERREIRREERMQKEKERKAAMNKPVPPLPERELCDYEILRDKNVREREKAMAESGFFEDLNEYKKKIGFSNDIQSEIKEKKTNNCVKEIESVEKIVSKKAQGKKGSMKSKMIRQNMKCKKKTQDEKEYKKDYGKNEDDKKKDEKQEDYEKEEVKKKVPKPEDLETEIMKPGNNSDYYDDFDCFDLDY